MEKLADIIEAAEMPLLEELLVTDDAPHADELLITEEPRPAEKKKFDLKTNRDLSQFLPYLEEYIGKLPAHSGKTTAGCERGIAHCNNGDKMISQVIAGDLEGELDDQQVEKYRKKLRQMKKQLEQRHKEINDAYDADDAKYATDTTEKIVKEAEESWTCPECGKVVASGDAEHKARHNAMEHGHEVSDKKEAHACSCEVTKTAAPENDMCPKCNIKLWHAEEGLAECIACEEVFERKLTKKAGTAKLTLVMTPFERAVTGAIVNGYVSQGKNPEEIYDHMKKKYSFTDRDELSIQQILMDMGYPILKDRGHLGDKSEQLNKGMGIEFSTQYSA